MKTIHEIANIFPYMLGDDFEGLVEDIRVNGLRVPITLYEDKILDGRSRAKACQRLGIEPATVDYDGDDPVGYVVSLNLKRRQLTESQRGMVAARIAQLGEGRPWSKITPPIGAVTPSVGQAAKALNIGSMTVTRAKRVLRSGNERLVKAVDEGKASVNAASKIAALPEPARKQAVERIAAGEKPAKVISEVQNKSVDAPKEPTLRRRTIDDLTIEVDESEITEKYESRYLREAKALVDRMGKKDRKILKEYLERTL